jgi:hypothetical protein
MTALSMGPTGADSGRGVTSGRTPEKQRVAATARAATVAHGRMRLEPLYVA